MLIWTSSILFILSMPMKTYHVHQWHTSFLKLALVGIAFIALVFACGLLPMIWLGGQTEIPGHPIILTVGVIAVALTIFPFEFALYQAYKLLRFIDGRNVFSPASIDALRTITWCALIMTPLYMLALPLAYTVAELDDAPGLIVLSTAFACAPLVVATFAAVLQSLVAAAYTLEQENALII